MEKIQPILTRERLVAADANQALGDTLARHAMGRKLLLVCDDKTWVAAGESLLYQLEGRFSVVPYSLGQRVEALLSHATAIAQNSGQYDGFIAVGAGTVNDITKYAATLAGKPYLCVATAASMNGYISAGASLKDQGFKQSYFAQPPRAVIADLSIIAASPKRLTRAGLGDTLCRSTVEADMMLSHYLLGTEYPRMLFDILRAHESALFLHATQLRDHDPVALKLLVNLLLETGNAMAQHGSSAVASQGEHMIAHTLELLYATEVRSLLHGEIIAITTLTMARLQQEMLGEIPPVIRSLPRTEMQFQRLFGAKAGGMLAGDYAQKNLTTEQVATLNTRLSNDWAHIKEQLAGIMLSLPKLERMFLQSTLPTQPRELKISKPHYENACNHAYLTRNRFTFLDLAAMIDKRL